MCVAQGPQCSDAGEARTRGLSVSSQALYHWAPYGVTYMCIIIGRFSRDKAQLWRDLYVYDNWALSRENLSLGVCEQQRCRPACEV